MQKIIDDKFLTDWEFIIDVIAPELEIEEFDIPEISKMVGDEIARRNLALHTNSR